jgi:hypothetical protein
MDHQKLFAQQTFAEETERITGGAVRWQALPEIKLEELLSNDFLMVRRPHLLAHLAAPWPEALPHGEVMLELKLAGNHLDREAVERALLQRQVRQVQRLEEDASWLGEEPLWLVAPHVPEWSQELHRPVRFAPGCYRIDPHGHSFLWIAANELPLRDELVPLLMARSGQALDEFGRWVAPRRPLEWVMSMLESMSMPTRQELPRRFPKVDDPEIQARRQEILDCLLETSPQTPQQLIDKGRLVDITVILRS